MPGSVLVVDDSLTIREEIVSTLRQVSLFAEYRQAGDGLEGFKSLLGSRADLVICDLEMPRMDGFRFLQLVNSRQELRGLPIIMLTGRGESQLKIKGLEEGACDYVTKPFDPGELIARVKVQLKIAALQDELKRSNGLLRESNARLTEMSNTDPLTGLYNRRYLMEFLHREVARSRRTAEPLSLVIIDVDHFKAINDTRGHQNGDAVLRVLAETARGSLRGYDIAARYGGEEFVLVLPSAPLAGAVVAAERLREGVEALSFPPPLQGLRVTASLGTAVFPSPGVLTVDELLAAADRALYRAKQKGRNRVESAGE